MAVFYKYEYTNKTKNTHPCEEDEDGQRVDGDVFKVRFW